MIVYFGTLFIIWLYGTFGNVNSSKRKKRLYVIFSFVLMVLIMSLRKYTVGRDLYGHYAESFLSIGKTKSFEDAISYGQLKGYGWGYSIINKIISMINPDIQFFIIVTSVFSLSVIGLFIYLYSKDVALSTFLFITNCSFYICFSIIRQSMAVSFVIIGYILFNTIKRNPWNYISFIAFIVFASTIHSSAILCLILILFLNMKFSRKQILVVLSVGFVLFMLYNNFYSLLINGFVRDSHYDIYLGVSADSNGAVNIDALIYLTLSAVTFFIGYYFMIWTGKSKKVILNNNYIETERNKSFLLFVSASTMICRLLVFRMNIFGRFIYYFVPFIYILCPFILEFARNKDNNIILKRFFYIIYTVYFLYMTFINAKLYYGVLPYEFYWQ